MRMATVNGTLVISIIRFAEQYRDEIDKGTPAAWVGIAALWAQVRTSAGQFLEDSGMQPDGWFETMLGVSFHSK